MSFAVFLVNGLGDQLIAWPTFRALRAALTGDMELWLGLGLYRSLYRDLDIAARHPVSWKDPDTGAIDTECVPQGRRPLELFVSTSDWGTPSVVELGRKLGAVRTVGLCGPFDEIAKAPRRCNMFDRLFSVAQHFDPRLLLEDYATPPIFSDAAEETAQRFVDRHLREGERALFVHPETRARKMWTPEGFASVLANFLDERPEYRVFLTSHRPYPLDLGRHQHRLTWVDAHFELALAILGRTDLFLGVDSCFLHGADLLRVPGVGLFGPTDPTDWGFRLVQPHRIVSTGGRPLEELAPKQVLEALLAVEAESR